MKEDYKRKLVYLDNPKISLEIFDCLLGDFIGSGCSREVYEYIPSKDFVVKVEAYGKSGDNYLEYNIWNEVRNTPSEKWFAPCWWISPGGKILIQKKTKDFYSKSGDKVPDKIPSFFTDIKPSNFGWMGNQLVAHDYAFTLGMAVSAEIGRNKMKSSKELQW